MVIVDFQQSALLTVIIQCKLLPAPRQDCITQSMQMEGRYMNGIIYQLMIVGYIELIYGARLRGILGEESGDSSSQEKRGTHYAKRNASRNCNPWALRFPYTRSRIESQYLRVHLVGHFE